MMHTLKNAYPATLSRLAALFVAVAGLAGCNYEGGDPRKEIGANPPLPALQQYLIPPIQVAKVSAWGKGCSDGAGSIQDRSTFSRMGTC
jgi:hypothetical protein